MWPAHFHIVQIVILVGHKLWQLSTNNLSRFSYLSHYSFIPNVIDDIGKGKITQWISFCVLEMYIKQGGGVLQSPKADQNAELSIIFVYKTLIHIEYHGIDTFP